MPFLYGNERVKHMEKAQDQAVSEKLLAEAKLFELQ